ncbi:MAG TPA: hypothetical protein VM536_22560, partial [Chloroflexia bacterium]|nr:hypothetical protein [Chloroflexia bacterium]
SPGPLRRDAACRKRNRRDKRAEKDRSTCTKEDVGTLSAFGGAKTLSSDRGMRTSRQEYFQKSRFSPGLPLLA